MAICPADHTACPDDLCRGSGCMKMGGYEMLERCDICGGLIDNEIPDCSTCTCGESGLDFDFDPHGDGPP